jgi:hypothetical protein
VVTRALPQLEVGGVWQESEESTTEWRLETV